VLVENLLASVSQHQRQKNGEQTVNRMRARVMNGYWPFACPVGYRYEKGSGHGKMLVRNEPLASIVQEALEGYESGRFQIQAEVKRFLEAQPAFPKVRGTTVLNQQVTNILTRPVYAGYVEAPNWNASLRRGHHEALVSFDTYRRNPGSPRGACDCARAQESQSRLPAAWFRHVRRLRHAADGLHGRGAVASGTRITCARSTAARAIANRCVASCWRDSSRICCDSCSLRRVSSARPAR
jgi:hypothetical protein